MFLSIKEFRYIISLSDTTLSYVNRASCLLGLSRKRMQEKIQKTKVRGTKMAFGGTVVLTNLLYNPRAEKRKVSLAATVRGPDVSVSIEKKHAGILGSYTISWTVARPRALNDRLTTSGLR